MCLIERSVNSQVVCMIAGGLCGNQVCGDMDVTWWFTLLLGVGQCEQQSIFLPVL